MTAPAVDDRLRSGSIARDLEAAMRRRGAPDASVSDVAAFGTGHSGFTYALELATDATTRRCVLRLSPPRARIAGPADVGRQGRIMAALAAAGAPAPVVLACSSDPEVDGRAFALMELVAGHGWEAAVAATSARSVGEGTLDALRRIQTLAPDASGIAGEAACSPANDVRRWAHLLVRGSTALRGSGAVLARRLEASAPELAARPVLTHGDFHYGNMIFDGARVIAVVDWEIATLGIHSPMSGAWRSPRCAVGSTRSPTPRAGSTSRSRPSSATTKS